MMVYDSRRWTGRYAPGERPAELGGGPAYRHRSLRWWLLGVIATALVVAIAQVWVNIGEGLAPMFVTGLSIASGRSPFARRRRDHYDEFEMLTLMQAQRRAYVAVSMLSVTTLGWCAVTSRYRWPMHHSFWDWATWAAAMLIVASNLPVLFAEFAIPFPPEDTA